MTRIKLNAVGKQYDEKWIFRGINLELTNTNHLAVTGYNGSGKSTFLQLLSAYTSPTEGNIEFSINEKLVDPNNWYEHITCGAPYIDLPEDLTLRENVRFFNSFKKFQNNLSVEELSNVCKLNESIDKQVKYFSSGMKQRLKLALAITADVPVLFLDEPTSNLDSNGVEWYCAMMDEYAKNKLAIICSNNQLSETKSCNVFININDYHN